MSTQTTKQNPFLTKTAIALVFLAAIAWGLALGFADEKPAQPTAKASKTVNLGETGIIRTWVVGGLTKDAYSEVMDAVAAKDEDGIKELVLSRKAIIVDNNTKAKLIDQGVFKVRVRLMSGDYKGAAVWIPSEYIESL